MRMIVDTTMMAKITLVPGPKIFVREEESASGPKTIWAPSRAKSPSLSTTCCKKLKMSAPHGVLRMKRAKRNCSTSPLPTVRKGKSFRLFENTQATPIITHMPNRLTSLSGMGATLAGRDFGVESYHSGRQKEECRIK